MSTVGVVDAETIALDACHRFRSPTLPPFPPTKAPTPPLLRRRPYLGEAELHASLKAGLVRDSSRETRVEAATKGDATLTAQASVAVLPLVEAKNHSTVNELQHVRCTFIGTICEDHFDTALSLWRVLSGQ